MKTLIYSFSFLILTAVASAQVGLDTNDPKTTFHIVGSADVAAAADGILLPTLSIPQLEAKMGAATYGADQDGVIVYIDDVSASSTISATSGITKKGIYYYDATTNRWLMVGESKLWSTTGNAGTDESTDFIGTTDVEGLSFRVNNTPAGKIGLPADGSVFLGYRAGESDDSSGNENTFIGYLAGRNTNTGGSNVAIGSEALFSNTSGVGNIAIGFEALLTNTSGDRNVAIGFEALKANTTGSNNTALGRQALANNTTADNNTAFGRSALFSNTTGFGNTALGFSSLSSNTVGQGNTAFGSTALNSNTDGNFNVAIGDSALEDNDTGDFNTAAGQSALRNNTASGSTAFGYSALLENVDGTENTAVGYQSLFNNESGNNNTAMGYEALFNNTGSVNTAVGYRALFANTNQGGLTAVGNQALVNNNSGDNSTAMGFNALLSNTSGDDNTAVGYNALVSNTSGSNNIALGVSAGDNIEGDNNTFLGTETSSSVTPKNLSGSIFIGYQAGQAENNNDRLYIENSNADENAALIYGEFDSDILRTNANFQVSNSGTNNLLAQIINENDDGRLYIYENGFPQIDLRAAGTSVFNEQGLDRDFRIESENNENVFFADADFDVVRFGSDFSLLNFNGSNQGLVTLDYVADFDNGSSGTAIGIGSAEMLVDGGAFITIIDANLIPYEDDDRTLGNGSYRWDAVWSQNGIIQTSDFGLKNNIKPLQYGLQELMQIETISYNWKKSHNQNTKIGFSAQNLLNIIPEVVVTEESVVIDEKTGAREMRPVENLGVYYSDIIPVVVKAIQEQQTLIDSQKTIIDQQHQKLEDQDKDIEELKSIVAKQQEQINLLMKKVE